MKLKWEQFGGIRPKVSAKLLGNNEAQVAENVNLLNGKLVSLNETSDVYTLPDANRKSIYRYHYPLYLLTCGASGTYSAFHAISDGSFKITIDDTEYSLTALNFTGAATLAACATIIQTALRAATGQYETVAYSTDHFVFTANLPITILSRPKMRKPQRGHKGL